MRAPDEKPPPAVEQLPRYWMHETSGGLRPAVEAYLAGAALTPEQIRFLRAYLRQWIYAPAWLAVIEARDAIYELRRLVDAVETRADLARWVRRGLAEGIDPL